MTALEDARAALIAEARTWPRDGINEGPLINALADEIERLTADLALYQEHAGLTFPRPLKFTPPTDAERGVLIDDLSATVDWLKRTCNLVDADRVMRAIAAIRTAGFRRPGPITDAQVDAAMQSLDPRERMTRAGMRAALEAVRDAS